MAHCDDKPRYNQFELHPLYIERETIKVCREHDINILAYTPLAKN